MARLGPGDLPGTFGKNSGSRANERVNRGDGGGAMGVAGGGFTPRESTSDGEVDLLR